jgi:microcystin-dependent protein
MADPFFGEIRAFGFNYAPMNWASCMGQSIAISQNQCLFALLSTYYGGDGRTYFCLPDLRGRVAIGQGNGPGLAGRYIGQMGGQERVVLTNQQMPSHSHDITHSLKADLRCSDGSGEKTSPLGATISEAENNAFNDDSPNQDMKSGSVMLEGDITAQNSGGNQPYDNMQPYLVINYCIALQGLWPRRP